MLACLKNFASVFLFACLFAAAQPLQSARYYSLSGTVTDPSGSRVAGAVIHLYNSGSLLRTQTTARDGAFSFPNLPPGWYLAECAAEGFQKQSRRVILVDRAETVEIQLELGGLHEEVSVVASDLPQVPTEIAKSVSLISADEISRRDLVFLTDAATTVPGLQVQQLGGPGQTAAFRFRGLRPEDTAILLDGFRFQDPSENKGAVRTFLSNLLTGDAEQIEVLRGASSTLYGTGAIGGLINVISRQPHEPLAAFVSLEGGSAGLIQGSAGVSGRTPSQRLTYSLQGTHVNYTRGQDAHDTYRDSGGSARVTYDPAPQVRLFARFSLTDSFGFIDEDPSPLPALAPLPPGESLREAVAYPEPRANFYAQLDDPDNHHGDRIVSGMFRLDHQVVRAWQQSLAYQSLRTRRRYDDGPALSSVAASLGIVDDPMTRRSYDGALDELSWRNSFELGGSDTLHFALGWDRTSLDQLEFGQTTQAAQKSLTLQLNNHARFLDGRLQLQLAGQAQYYRLDAPRFSDSSGSPYGSVAHLDVPATYNGDVALAYYLARSGTKLRLHVGNGFRSPSLYERFGSGGSGFYYGNPGLRAEHALFADTGVDQFLLENKLQLSTTVFYTHLRTVVAFDLLPDADPFGRFFGYLNIGGGNARGVELAVTARPNPNLDLAASYAYTNSDQPAPSPSVGMVRVPGLSDHQLTLGVRMQPWRRLNLDWQTYAVSSHDFPLFGASFPFSSGTYRFPGYVRADLTGTYLLREGERTKVRLVVRIDNLLNRKYYNGGFLAPQATVRSGLRLEW
jgi:iron complex outermembrane receptor protein